MLLIRTTISGDSERYNKNFSFNKSRLYGTFKIISSKKYDPEL
jgi:hypothetical protein